MTKRHNTVLAAVELPIMTAIEAIANEMKESYGEDAEGSLLDFYGEAYMENLSAAGYSETRPNDRLSIRAFAHLIRVKPADLKVLKDTLGYDGNKYRDFALSDNVISALSRSTDLAPALKLLAPSQDEKSVGPFYPSRTKFDVAAALKSRAGYIGEVKKIVGKDDAVDAAAVKLAAVFKLTAVDKVARQLKAVGVTGEAAVAHAVLIALRNDARLVAGLRCAQPSETA